MVSYKGTKRESFPVLEGAAATPLLQIKWLSALLAVLCCLSAPRLRAVDLISRQKRL